METFVADGVVLQLDDAGVVGQGAEVLHLFQETVEMALGPRGLDLERKKHAGTGHVLLLLDGLVCYVGGGEESSGGSGGRAGAAGRGAAARRGGVVVLVQVVLLLWGGKKYLLL